MGRRKRTLELDGGAAVSRGRPKQPVRDLDLEGTADPGEMGIIGGNSDEGRADGDPPMEETEGAGIVGDDSGEGRDRPAYFMACHWDWAGHPKPFSVYKVDAAGLSDASSTPSPVSRQRLRRVTRLDTGAGGVVGKSFVSVRSKQRAWIVGVGGRAGETIIFDTDTHAVIHGPGLKSAKHCPVLAAVGDRVYALCKSPSWVSDPDFPPWFEVLDLSQARVVTVAGRFHLEGCSWSDLPYPPCLPWKLSLADYNRATMPMVITTSSVVVGSYILVSFDKQWGTHAFDTILCEWHKVHDDPLPFAGYPAMYGGSVYLGVSKRNGPGPISGYHIRVTPSGKDLAPKLSITVLPVNYEGHGVDSGDRFCSLGNGRFCSLSFVLRRFIRNPVTKYRVPRKAHLDLRTYQVDPSLLATLGESLDVNQEIAFTSQLEQDYKICSSSHGFSPYAFALLSI